MRNRPKAVPTLYVEGPDDISAIAALLKRHGYDTEQGKRHLLIRAIGSDSELLSVLADTIKSERSLPCGFVLDIDTEARNRWKSVCDRLAFNHDPNIELTEPLPAECSSDGLPGYIGQLKGYPSKFGVWLMPDCKSDGQKLEHLMETLIPSDDPLFPFARQCTTEAARLVDAANQQANLPWERFTDANKIKAEMRTWLAWRKEPGVPFGAAINDTYLRHDSPQALAFLDWLKRLFRF